MKRILKKLIYFFAHLLYIFPVKKNRVFLVCFDGRKLGFDAKAVVDYARENGHNYEFVWGCGDLECVKKYSSQMSGVKFVKYKSLKGVINLMTAQVIIYNINLPAIIPFRKKQLRINTWHGFPYKRVGKYTNAYSKENFNKATCFMSHSRWYTENVIRDSFEFEGDVLECGTPRNDVFFTAGVAEIEQKVKGAYGIPADKKTVLFAPTFRGEFNYEESGIDFRRLTSSLSERFGGEWVILFRVHPLLAANMTIDHENYVNVSAHQDMQELLCCADVLVTDYSSSMWDFSILGRPVFLYADDIDRYEKDRGLYVSFDSLPFVVCRNNDELESGIKGFDENEYAPALQNYKNDMGSFESGRACAELFEYIKDKLK